MYDAFTYCYSSNFRSLHKDLCRNPNIANGNSSLFFCFNKFYPLFYLYSNLCDCMLTRSAGVESGSLLFGHKEKTINVVGLFFYNKIRWDLNIFPSNWNNYFFESLCLYAGGVFFPSQWLNIQSPWKVSTLNKLTRNVLLYWIIKYLHDYDMWETWKLLRL